MHKKGGEALNKNMTSSHGGRIDMPYADSAERQCLITLVPSAKFGGEALSRYTYPKTTTKRLLLDPNMGLLSHGKSNSDYKYFISGGES